MTILGTHCGDVAEGTARYDQGHPCCQRCGRRAWIWDIDGSWCNNECQRANRREVKR